MITLFDMGRLNDTEQRDQIFRNQADTHIRIFDNQFILEHPDWVSLIPRQITTVSIAFQLINESTLRTFLQSLPPTVTTLNIENTAKVSTIEKKTATSYSRFSIDACSSYESCYQVFLHTDDLLQALPQIIRKEAPAITHFNILRSDLRLMTEKEKKEMIEYLVSKNYPINVQQIMSSQDLIHDNQYFLPMEKKNNTDIHSLIPWRCRRIAENDRLPSLDSLNVRGRLFYVADDAPSNNPVVRPRHSFSILLSPDQIRVFLSLILILKSNFYKTVYLTIQHLYRQVPYLPVKIPLRMIT